MCPRLFKCFLFLDSWFVPEEKPDQQRPDWAGVHLQDHPQDSEGQSRVCQQVILIIFIIWISYQPQYLLIFSQYCTRFCVSFVVSLLQIHFFRKSFDLFHYPNPQPNHVLNKSYSVIILLILSHPIYSTGKSLYTPLDKSLYSLNCQAEYRDLLTGAKRIW